MGSPRAIVVAAYAPLSVVAGMVGSVQTIIWRYQAGKKHNITSIKGTVNRNGAPMRKLSSVRQSHGRWLGQQVVEVGGAIRRGISAQSFFIKCSCFPEKKRARMRMDSAAMIRGHSGEKADPCQKQWWRYIDFWRARTQFHVHSVHATFHECSVLSSASRSGSRATLADAPTTTQSP